MQTEETKNVESGCAAPAVTDVISEKSFRKLNDIVYRESGIVLGEQKRVMLSSRILRRLRATGCETYEEYIDYLSDADKRDNELVFMVDAVTTNKTDFFREKHHFDYLSQTLLPALDRKYHFSTESPLRVWSAGCSSGEEPYTLSFVLSEFFHGEIEKYRILATDLSTEVLGKALRGIYPETSLEEVPKYIRLKYMQRGGGKWQGYWRVIPELRRTVSFGKLNLMDSSYGINERFHFIFHRNVMIYFNRHTREMVVKRLWERLEERGYLFIGHSETLHQISDKFTLEAQTVYRKKPSEGGGSE